MSLSIAAAPVIVASGGKYLFRRETAP